jgi:hypothetical protein
VYFAAAGLQVALYMWQAAEPANKGQDLLPTSLTGTDAMPRMPPCTSVHARMNIGFQRAFDDPGLPTITPSVP